MKRIYNTVYAIAFAQLLSNFALAITAADYTSSLVGPFSDPYGLILDSSNTLYVVERVGAGGENQGRVAKVTYADNAYSTTYIATGLNYPIGISIDSSDNLYVADKNNHRILKITKTEGVYSSSSIASGFNFPQGVVAALSPSNDLYITDTNNNTIKKLTYNSGTGAWRGRRNHVGGR